MIRQNECDAIRLLLESGLSIREVSRRLNLSRNTVRAILQPEDKTASIKRLNKLEIDPELLRRLFTECQGWAQRIHERLEEEHQIEIGYSTLTRLLRDEGLKENKKQRCSRVPDEPGAEMQHDTSPYKIKIGGERVGVVASVLYYRYSKRRYLKFYRTFERFKMKCFLYEALMFYGYSAKTCIIDNTNLARLRGTGRNAIIVPEMKEFSKALGFEFICHEVMHSNRKAGNERSFYTIESNFFPGRTFSSMEDLNIQAFDWATVRLANRPISKTKLIPAKAFEYEISYLTKIPIHIVAPYLEHPRSIDQYGYVSLHGNYYWVPEGKYTKANILEYSNSIAIYNGRELLQTYDLPVYGTSNQVIFPPGKPKPKRQPKSRKKATAEEEKKLRAIAEEVDSYLNFIIPLKGISKHRFIRALHFLSEKMTSPLFIKAIKRSLKYRITDLETIERIAVLQMTEGHYILPDVEQEQEFNSRDSYLEGCVDGEIDLSDYDKMWEPEDDD